MLLFATIGCIPLTANWTTWPWFIPISRISLKPTNPNPNSQFPIRLSALLSYFSPIRSPSNRFLMATKSLPSETVTILLTKEAIALTEKKVGMSLDDIIKMSKANAGKRQQRVSNKSRGFFNRNQDRSFKVRQYINSRSTVRQGYFVQKRSNFQGNNFPSVAGAAQMAATSTFRNRPVNHRNAGNWNKPRPGGPVSRQGNASNGGKKQHQRQKQQGHTQKPKALDSTLHNKPQRRTLDSMFANMKEQRMRSFTRPNNDSRVSVVARGNGGNQPTPPWLRSRFGNYRN